MLDVLLTFDHLLVLKKLVAKTNAKIPCSKHGIAIERDNFHSSRCLFKRHVSDGRRIQSNHDPGFAFCQSSHRSCPESQ
jgi:hypothetical protein